MKLLYVLLVAIPLVYSSDLVTSNHSSFDHELWYERLKESFLKFYIGHPDAPCNLNSKFNQNKILQCVAISNKAAEDADDLRAQICLMTRLAMQCHKTFSCYWPGLEYEVRRIVKNEFQMTCGISTSLEPRKSHRNFGNFFKCDVMDYHVAAQVRVCSRDTMRVTGIDFTSNDIFAPSTETKREACERFDQRFECLVGIGCLEENQIPQIEQWMAKNNFDCSPGARDDRVVTTLFASRECNLRDEERQFHFIQQYIQCAKPSREEVDLKDEASFKKSVCSVARIGLDCLKKTKCMTMDKGLEDVSIGLVEKIYGTTCGCTARISSALMVALLFLALLSVGT